MSWGLLGPEKTRVLSRIWEIPLFSALSAKYSGDSSNSTYSGNSAIPVYPGMAGKGGITGIGRNFLDPGYVWKTLMADIFVIGWIHLPVIFIILCNI